MNGAGVLTGPARKMYPGGMPPGLEPTMYGAGDKCVSSLLLPDVVVYPHSEPPGATVTFCVLAPPCFSAPHDSDRPCDGSIRGAVPSASASKRNVTRESHVFQVCSSPSVHSLPLPFIHTPD